MFDGQGANYAPGLNYDAGVSIVSMALRSAASSPPGGWLVYSPPRGPPCRPARVAPWPPRESTVRPAGTPRILGGERSPPSRSTGEKDRGGGVHWQRLNQTFGVEGSLNTRTGV